MGTLKGPRFRGWLLRPDIRIGHGLQSMATRELPPGIDYTMETETARMKLRPSRPRVVNPWDEQNRLLEGAIEALASQRGTLRILEAGCGNKWPLRLQNVEFTLVGIDSDAAALEARAREFDDLDETLLGDLRTANFAENSFDVIFSSFVLEHICGAEAVLDNFVRWLSPGGVIILRIPDRDSVYGFMTRILPFPVHVFFKKYVTRDPHAGEPGHDPYPTFYDQVVSRSGIWRFCRERDLEIQLEFASNHYLPALGRLAPVVLGATKLVEFASLRRLSADYNNLAYVIRKPPVGQDHGEYAHTDQDTVSRQRAPSGGS